MAKNLKVGMLVRVENSIGYGCEGKIKSITESSGAREGLLYEVGIGHFFEDEITPIAMPSIYEHIATEMLRRDCWKEDKRVLQLAISNKNFTFTKKGRKIVVGIDAWGKHFEKSYYLGDIRHHFRTWRVKDQPSYIWSTNPSYFN